MVWFQGCTLGCPGCFNPATHDPAGGYAADTATLAAGIAALTGIEGVSISGGEPFQQPEALADLTARLRNTALSVLVFSGYKLEAIEKMPLGPAILSSLDVLVDGPYLQSRHLGRGLLGSSNQRIHFLTPRYTPADFQNLPRGEIILHRDGSITLSGVNPLDTSR